MFKEGISDLLDRKMDRKEFLAYMGALALSIFGVMGLLRALRDPHHNLNYVASNKKRGSGYGSGGYGRS